MRLVGKYTFGLLCLLLVIFLGNRFYANNWLDTDLTSLLPKEQSWSQVQILADNQQTQALNKQVVALIGKNDREQAFALAKEVESLWQQSNLFGQKEQISLDLEALKQEIKYLSFATLPSRVVEQLYKQPTEYFQQYAQEIVNPFLKSSIIPANQDWLGFTRFTLTQAVNNPKVQWDYQHNMVYVQEGDITWILLTGELAGHSFAGDQTSLLNLVSQTQALVQENQGQMLITGASLFSATTQQQAEKESTYMSIIGISLTLTLLLVVFRSLKSLWLFLPIFIGLAWGIALTLVIFGKIHIMTLVIGTSLIGVLIDFPLHWLSSALFKQQWQGRASMQQLAFTFFISLLITVLGYILLAFTTLPILKQTAFFSAGALIASVLSTYIFLPSLFKNYHNKPIKKVPKFLNASLQIKLPSLAKKVFILLGVLVVGLGLMRSHWQDNMRQWISIPTSMLEQAKKIAQLTGVDLSTQYLLITAKDPEQLLAKNAQISQAIKKLEAQVEFTSLSQWLLDQEQQLSLANYLTTSLPAESYQALNNIGISSDTITQALEAYKNYQPVSLEQALETNLGKAWKFLYLGKLEADTYASVIKFNGLDAQTIQVISSLADNKEVFWQDKAGHLNQSFQEVRDQAMWLKVISIALALLFLWKVFGLVNSLKMLLIPLVSIVIITAIFGWLGITIGLFVMFGFLLISAIGIDYTAYMQTVNEPLAHKRVSILLTSMTTILTFMILGFSSTPAVAAFGITVSLGVLFNLILIFTIYHKARG
ncbi:hypothetical protein CKF54_06335 [Psittacicella hinzii]|uniref:SSD domain-containing protein n=1 Tax=Psittacicella hinzii TaxID=2028575 RepID=A0A3A1Y025_9GAMM|nr:MMPL family transporter [Psittacicella hinzii]RIY31652.1 hypothetical protein CKF54_06335 [Psittacicella hinzii]